jgi:hypothetical protein
MKEMVNKTSHSQAWHQKNLNRVKFGPSANEKSGMCLRIGNELPSGKLSSYKGLLLHILYDRMMLTHLTLISDLDNDTYALGSMPQSAE